MTNREEQTMPPAPETGGDDGWILVIDTQLDETHEQDGAYAWSQRRLLGLPVILRLALTAQAAGARAIELGPTAFGPTAEIAKKALADDRLKIPVREAAPSVENAHRDAARHGERDENPVRARGARRIRVPANLVVHRGVLTALGKMNSRREFAFSARAVESSRANGLPRTHESSPAVEASRASASPVDEASRHGASSPADDPFICAASGLGPYGFSPMIVSDEASFAAAQKALLRALRKPQDGWTSTHLNRPISLAITQRLVATDLQPNQVSVAILGVGLLGAFLATRGTYVSLALGALLFHTQSVLDGCDGEMSRLTFRGSHMGEWLDTIGDDLTNYGYFGGAAWGLFATTGQRLYLILGAITLFCGVLGSGLEYRYLISIGSGDLLKYPLGIGKAPGAEGAPPKSALGRVLDAVSPLFKRDTFVLLTLLGAVLGALGPLLAIFAAGAVGVLFAVIKAEIRMMRERAAQSETDPSGVEKAT